MNLEAKKKDFTIPPLVIASLVPIGLYAFSKYKDYDSKKTKKVVIIGSVVILGALVVDGLSGMWSGNTISKRIFSRITGKKINQKQVLKPIDIRNQLPLPIQGSTKKISDCQKKWDSKPESSKGMIGEVRNARQNYFMYNCVNDIKPVVILN